MNKIQPWQAIALAVVAVAIATVVIIKTAGVGQKPAAIPAPMTAAMPITGRAGGPPVPPPGFPGAPPARR